MATIDNRLPTEGTQIDIEKAIRLVAAAVGGGTASDVTYDGTSSGLSATNVQDAIDEVVGDIPTVNDGTLTIQKNGSDVATFTANASSNVVANVTVPTTTSELTNNSDFVSDASYVHTDNNFTNAEKTKLGGIESGAEVNVQSDWNEADNTKDDYIKNKPSSEVKSATDTFTTVNGGLLSKCLIDLVPVQSGSGDPSPDNVRPISGHTEVDLYNVGFNLWDEEWEVGGFDTNGTTNNTTDRIRSKNYISCVPNTTYYIKQGTLSDTEWSYFVFYDAHKNVIGNRETVRGNFTTPANAYFMKFNTNNAYGVTYNHDICINISNPNKNGTYEPYLGHLYQVQIGQTVYGGTVDLVSGVMTATWAGVDMGTLAFTQHPANINVYYSTGLTQKAFGIDNIVSEMFSVDAISPVASLPNGKMRGLTNNVTVYFSLNVSTAQDFINAVTGTILVYELATPFTIQLTPQQIEALVGQNNLSTPLDGQSIDSVKYREVFAFDDVEKVVSLRVPISMLGTDESERTTASQSYASGDYFYKDGYMCKALTSISAGATLTLNTNYSQGTLADILKAIENA